MQVRKLAAMGMLVFAAGCGVGTGTVELDGEEVLLEGEEELSATSQSYVTLRRDTRRCMWPLCGGYFVADVNRVRLSEKYVSGLDFSLAGVSMDDAATVRSSPANEVFLRGKLGPIEPQFKTRAFRVTEAYLGMSGAQASAGEKFYKAADRSPAINCFTAPCDNLVATRLNSTAKTFFTALSVDRAAKPLVDKAWLVRRAQAKGAVVAAQFTPGAIFPGGPEKVLDASQVFVRLPERIGPCPMAPIRQCPAGSVMTFTRNADRCEIPTGCVIQGMCTMSLPNCDPGYRLSSWSAAPLGCPQHACDPAFASP